MGRLGCGPLLGKMSACDRRYCRLPKSTVVLPSVVTVAVCSAVLPAADVARIVYWPAAAGTAVVMIGSVDEYGANNGASRSEEHTSELQSLMRISYAVFCLKKKTKIKHL